MTVSTKPRLIAYYLPQYHPIPENDAWWGSGFTEWTNVAKAKPLFKGHYQPHIPADLGFYDLRLPEARQAQADLAREYGISGFCYWHYWLGGRRLLERPFNEVLTSGEPDFPFCLAWANHSWTGTWFGAPDKVLVEQTYPGKEDIKAHFDTLLPAFRDQRYIQVDGKPFLAVFQPSDLTTDMLAYWNELAVKAGLKGIYWVGIIKNTQEGEHIRKIGFDACTISRTNGRGTTTSPLKKLLVKWRGEKRAAVLYQKIFKRPFHTYVYNRLQPYIDVKPGLNLDFFPCVMPNWDNTPRAGLDGQVFMASSPAVFQQHLHKALERVKDADPDRQIVIVKSWNEWAEGNHLEPDQRDGRGYLEAIRSELAQYRERNA